MGAPGTGSAAILGVSNMSDCGDEKRLLVCVRGVPTSLLVMRLSSSSEPAAFASGSFLGSYSSSSGSSSGSSGNSATGRSLSILSPLPEFPFFTGVFRLFMASIFSRTQSSRPPSSLTLLAFILVTLSVTMSILNFSVELAPSTVGSPASFMKTLSRSGLCSICFSTTFT